MTQFKKVESAVIHAGIYGDQYTKSVNVPIYQTSTYGQPALYEKGSWEYSRSGNPTRAALEKLVADLEHGSAAFGFASGMAAITAVFQLFNSGDKILLCANVYGGTFRLLDTVFKQFKLNFECVDTSDLSKVEEKITEDVKAIYVETPSNPLLNITDLKAVADLAHKHQILSIVDNTFLTPYLQQPLDFGIDIVIHSATKYLGGHSDVVAGLVVVNSQELADKVYFVQNTAGAIVGPFDAFLLLRGIKTLAVRLDRHCENAQKLAEFLDKTDGVTKVYYPGLKTHQGYEIHQRQAKNGGAMISFELDDKHDVKKFFSALDTILLAESLGGVESLICHPASMTHAALSEEEQLKAGITKNLIRFSVGIEAFEDLRDDLDNAIKASAV
ncbi:MAG: PLP-dependent aspartate aminotransferase family protein [Succinatimonas sp.]|jgi:cystathionine beta-lyase|nr:PLP-dependent aspartate aminotransferase family protein [Succinatimonas sp.]MDD5869204.1 PLP-dependent aspartate aminotransferase family protein [Succinatimonas sp.]